MAELESYVGGLLETNGPDHDNRNEIMGYVLTLATLIDTDGDGEIDSSGKISVLI